MSERVNLSAWLVRMSGPLVGTRYLLREDVTRVGRGPQNDIIIADAPTISVNHLEIRKDGSGYQIRDLESTNGTFVNGARIVEAALKPPCSIQLGVDGPELTFLVDDTVPVDFKQTLESRPGVIPAPVAAKGSRPGSGHEDILAEALGHIHVSRHRDGGDHTVTILRQMLHKATHRTRRKFTGAIIALVISLLVMGTYGVWRVNGLKTEKNRIDAQIRDVEAKLQKASQDPDQANLLYDRLNNYQDQARDLESNLLYRVSVRRPADPMEEEIRGLLAEFGAETYSVPPEFLEQVKRFIEQYQGPDRPHILRGLGRGRRQMDVVRGIFREEHLPPDLAYMAIVESSLSTDTSSDAGASGLWQFTPPTARAYGLKVDKSTDERLDVRKSSLAACRYIRELILDFGAGSSVMLALAAYNLGPSKVKQAIHHVTDPIKQRNFWYLYRVRALPEETREYVPKVIAVLIIARHPERFGFNS